MKALSQKQRRFLKWLATLAIMLGLAMGLAVWFAKSSYFANLVRSRIIAELADTTGGRVEIRRIDWNLWRLEFDLQDVTIHGLEKPSDIPYAHVDRFFLKGKVGSLFHRALGLRYLQLDRPIIHLIVYPDGSTNQPRPRGRHQDANVPLQTIFEYSINKTDVRDGKLVLNDTSIPLDFAVNDLIFAMTWFKSANRYDAKMHAGKLDAVIKGARPISAVADAEFSLSSNSAELKGLKLVSGNSRLQMNGHLEDLSKPAINLNYQGTLDLADMGSIMRSPQMRAGTMDVQGRATYIEGGFLASGKAGLRSFEWRDAQMHFQSIAASADYRIDKGRLSLAHISGQLLGGTLAGEGTIDAWCPGCFPGSPKEQRAEIKLQLSGLSSRQVARVFSTPSLPIEDLKPLGTAGGSLQCHWVDSASNAVLAMDLAAQPPLASSEDGLPVSARLRAQYELKTGIMNATEMSAITPATRANAAGQIGKRLLNLHLFAATAKIEELKPLFAPLYDLDRLQLKLHGDAVFNGSITGSMPAPTITGHLAAADFEFTSPFSADNNSPKATHWDELGADLEFGPKLLALHSGILRDGATRFAFDGATVLTQYRLTATTPFTLKVAANNAPLARIQALIGYNYPVSGSTDFNIDFGGTRASPHGNGRVQIHDASFFGQSVETARSDLAFTDQDLRLTNLSVNHGSGHVVGSLTYGFNSRAFDFNLRGNDVPLQEIAFLTERNLGVTGRANFAAKGSGTPTAPSLDADLQISKLSIAGENVGDLVIAQARTSGNTMNMTARSVLGGGNFDLQGAVRMRDQFDFNAVARLQTIDVRPLWLIYSKTALTGRSAVSGQVQLQGSLKNWRDTGLQASLSAVSYERGPLHIHNDGPVNFTFSKRALTVQQLHLAGDGTDLSGTGTAQFDGEQKLDFRAEGRADLKILAMFDPDITSYGTATLNLRVGGTIDNPRTNGRIQIANAAISHIDIPNGLSDLNGTFVFNRDRLQVQSLTARSGGGTVNFAGYIAYGRTLSFNLLVVGDDIRLRYPQGISSTASANLRLTGTTSTAVLSGDILLKKFSITPQFDLANYVAKSKQPISLPRPNSMLYNIRMDVHVTSTPELQVQTALAKVSGNVDLRVRGSAARPSVLGRVNITDGDVSFQGTKYHLERGDITFSNPAEITPIFDVAATTRVRDYDISLGFHGSTDRLTTNYRSDPPLATADIIALLAFGRTREESAREASGSQPLSEQASNVILGQALNATISSRMQKLFGVSRIKIDPYVGGAANNPSSARVTVEQQVAKDLTVTYITDLSKSNQQIISMEYNVSRKVSIVAVRDQYGIVSFDVRIRQRKK